MLVIRSLGGVRLVLRGKLFGELGVVPPKLRVRLDSLLCLLVHAWGHAMRLSLGLSRLRCLIHSSLVGHLFEREL